MVTKQIKELEVTKAKIIALEKAIAKRLEKELSSLHDKYGFGSLDEFISALRGISGGRSGRKASRFKASKGAAKSKRRKRSVITDETRTSVKKMVEGGKTGSQIAKALGISLPSVQNIKKALGLVKARS
jgi:DNA-binding CsgD family transcriptional regulator